MPPNMTRADPTGPAKYHHFEISDMIWSQCLSCEHRARIKKGATPYCLAFPDGIPDDLMYNRVDHHFSVSGDNGIQWDREPGSLIPNPFGEGD